MYVLTYIFLKIMSNKQFGSAESTSPAKDPVLHVCLVTQVRSPSYHNYKQSWQKYADCPHLI